jgi:hypothetical protein
VGVDVDVVGCRGSTLRGGCGGWHGSWHMS